MDGDEADLAEIDELARRWERAGRAFAAEARRWRDRAAPDTARFAERAAAALADHARAAAAAAERLRDYRAAVASVDEEGARSVRCAIQAAASMSPTPIADVTTTPVSNA